MLPSTPERRAVSGKRHYYWFPDGTICYEQPTDKPAPQIGNARGLEAATRLVARHAQDLANSLHKPISWTLHGSGWDVGSITGVGTVHPKKDDIRADARDRIRVEAKERAHDLLGWKLGHKFVVTDPETQESRAFEITYQEVQL